MKNWHSLLLCTVSKVPCHKKRGRTIYFENIGSIITEDGEINDDIAVRINSERLIMTNHPEYHI
jgi:hypothetical protein